MNDPTKSAFPVPLSDEDTNLCDGKYPGLRHAIATNLFLLAST